MKIQIKNILAMSALCVSGLAVADSYNIDLGARASHVDFNDPDDKQNISALSGAYYFNGVNTENVPLAQAAFLGKNSNINASAGHSSSDYFTGNNYRAGVEFFIPESFLYAAAGISQFRYDMKNSKTEFSDNDWDAAIGITPIDGLLVATHYGHDEGYNANIYAKYVTAVGGDQFINIEASYEDADEGAVKVVMGDFYFDSSFNIGGGFIQQNSDDGYIVRTRKFFTEQISAELSYSDYSDAKVVNVGVSVRF